MSLVDWALRMHHVLVPRQWASVGNIGEIWEQVVVGVKKKCAHPGTSHEGIDVMDSEPSVVIL